MDKTFEMSLPGPHDGPLARLHEYCGDSFESILEIAVLKPGQEQSTEGASASLLAYRQLGLIGPDVYTNWGFVFDQQVTRWVSAIAYRRENPALLKRLSPALHDLSLRLDDFQPEWADVPFMRTVRMLLLLEVLLVPQITFDSARTTVDRGRTGGDWRVWRSRLHQEGEKLGDASEWLGEMVRGLSSTYVSIGDTGWCISLPMLMLTAVVYSQYEYYASVLWQAHSALRARDELQRKWETALKGIPRLEHCLRFVALLIRYQSAVGKLVRQSGDARFLEVARAFAEETSGTFSQPTVLDALRLMSILEEARLRRLPGTNSDTLIGPCRLNAGATEPWESAGPSVQNWYLVERSDLAEEELQAFGPSTECLDTFAGRVFRSPRTLRETLGRCLAAGKLPHAERSDLVDGLVEKARQTAATSILRMAAACRAATPAPPGSNVHRHTWTYASRLDVCDDDARCFKQFVERHYAALLSPEDARCTSDVAVFSFGLSQSRDLKPLLERCVTEVAEAVRAAADAQKKEAGVKAFQKRFRLTCTAIPCGCGSPVERGEVEHVVEIQLREELAAWGLLLPGDGGPPAAVADGGRSGRRSAGDLLGRLFDKAVGRFALEEHALYGERYVPFPLLHRMLEVVARLRPSESLSVAVQFDGCRRRLLRLPTGLDQRRHEHLVRYLAGYVHAVVLNQAMTLGFRSCDVSFDGLEDPSEGKSRTGKPVTPAEWRQTIQEAYGRNCYEILVEKYLRDFNTERRSVQFLEVSRPRTLRKPAPDQVAGELEQWIEANPTREADASTPKTHQPERDTAGAQLLLGLDVGATLTKIQFYSVKSGRLERVGRAYQIHTPRLADRQGRKGDDPADVFAAELVRSLEQISESDDELKSRFEDRRAIVRCVGVAWPGPVRDNHVAGTSRILANFPPLSPEIVKNRIEEILDLDVAGAIQRQLERSRYLTQGERPLVALLNDGDAAGYGTLVIDGKLPGRRLAVVKIGTGTATSVLDDGQLVAGPCEGGKVMLDLGATPARDRPGRNEYPNGAANAYLSKRLMPEMAKKLVEAQHLDFRVDGLGNREFGLFLADDPRPLCDQCGLRDLAEEKSIGVEILRRVLEKGDKAEIELAHQVERILNVGGTAAIARLRELVEERGLIRLAEVLHVPTEQVRHYFDTIGDSPSHAISRRSSDPQAVDVQNRIRLFRQKVVEPSARALGAYLGDFLVLLATQYGVDAFIVAGGVVRCRTGDFARNAAIQRAARYGFKLRPRGSLLQLVERPPWMAGVDASQGCESPRAAVDQERSDAGQQACANAAAPAAQPSGFSPAAGDSESESDPGYGTAGAAVFAAGEFLLARKQKGLGELRSKILRLPTNRCALLAKHRVCFEDEAVDDVLLPKYALGAEEVKQFLARERTVVQTEGPEGTARYVRILTERSQAFETQH